MQGWLGLQEERAACNTVRQAADDLPAGGTSHSTEQGDKRDFFRVCAKILALVVRNGRGAALQCRAAHLQQHAGVAGADGQARHGATALREPPGARIQCPQRFQARRRLLQTVHAVQRQVCSTISSIKAQQPAEFAQLKCSGPQRLQARRRLLQTGYRSVVPQDKSGVLVAHMK